MLIFKLSVYLVLVNLTALALHDLIDILIKRLALRKESKAEDDAEKVVKMEDWR